MSLFDYVRTHLLANPQLERDRHGQPAELELRVATVVLLLETAYGDHEYTPVERDAIRRGIKREFGIVEKDAVDLMERAARARKGPGADLSSIASPARGSSQDAAAEKRRPKRSSGRLTSRVNTCLGLSAGAHVGVLDSTLHRCPL